MLHVFLSLPLLRPQRGSAVWGEVGRLGLTNIERRATFGCAVRFATFQTEDSLSGKAAKSY